MKQLGISFLLLVLMSLQACKQNQTVPIAPQKESNGLEVVDARGGTVKLKAPAQRVVVLFEAFVDAVFMLDAQKTLVGIPSQVYLTPDSYAFFSTLSPEFAAKTIATPSFNGRSVNMETLLALQPDLVVTFSQDLQMIQQMEALGLQVFVMEGLTMDQTLKEFEHLGLLLGRAERANKITSYMRGEIEKLKNNIPEKKKTAYYVWSRGRVLSTSGRGTLMDGAIQLAGVENACPLEMEAPNIGVEMLYKWNPDLMLLWNTPTSEVYALKELAQLPAVVNKQVFEMKPIFLFDPHTVKQVLFSKQLRHWAYPELYTQEMFEKELEEAKSILYKY